MIPHTLVLKPGLVIHSIYNGYWFWGRPSLDELWRDLRAATSGDPPGLGSEHTRTPRRLDRGRPLALPRLGPAHGRPSHRDLIEPALSQRPPSVAAAATDTAAEPPRPDAP